jgi:hypothetical protein
MGTSHQNVLNKGNIIDEYSIFLIDAFDEYYG